MRVRRHTTVLLLIAAATMLINTSCARRAVLVPNTDYSNRSIEGADLYRIITTDKRMFMATEIEITDSAVIILALENKDETLVFGAERYENVTLPLEINFLFVQSLEKMERSLSASLKSTLVITLVTILVALIVIDLSGGVGWNLD